MTFMETERKFLVASVPEDLQDHESHAIAQGYLALGEDGSEVRLRDKSGCYLLTVKSAGSLSRREIEVELGAEQFTALWQATEGKRVEKRRYEIRHDGDVFELDVYAGELDGLLTVEVEFDDEAASRGFVPPDWFGREITDDIRYKNQRLAIDGIPKS